MEHENVDLLAPRHGVDRRRPGIARRRADDGQVIVTARQEAFEQLSQQLQRDILERQGRAVEQFEQPMLMIELHQRHDRLMAEPAIGGGA